jgi:hypothetical protein
MKAVMARRFMKEWDVWFESIGEIREGIGARDGAGGVDDHERGFPVGHLSRRGEGHANGIAEVLRDRVGEGHGRLAIGRERKRGPGINETIAID